MDPITTPVGLPTGNNAPVGGAPAATSASDPVNPAPAPAPAPFPLPFTPVVQTLPAPQQQVQQAAAGQPGAQVVSLADYNAMREHYETRVRNLMSEKDKALNERNQSIAAQAELQRHYTELQASAQNGLQTSTQAAQTLFDQNRQLQGQVSQLQGQVLRSQALADHPELLPYAEYIPATNDADVIKQSIEHFSEIRNRDLQSRGFTSGLPPTGGVPQQPYAPGLFNTAGTPGSQQQAQQAPFPQSGGPGSVANLYPNRPTLPLSMQAAQQQQIGSTPAMMSPGGAASGLDAIAKLLSDAQQSGDQNRFEQALQQAAAMSDALTQQQLAGVSPALLTPRL